jgi:hypothetical protein
MNIRKLHIRGACCLLLSSFFINATDDIDFENSLDIENIDSERDNTELSLEDIDDNLLEAAFQSRPETRESTPTGILELLYTQTGINRILKHDLYNYTYPLPTRNIITYPTLFNFTPNHSQVGFSFFYQQTTNMFPWCNNIEGYLNLYEPTVMREIDLEIAQENGIDIPKTMSLFKNARVEQRRVGFLLNVWKKFNWFNIGIELPFYAVEKNYNIPPEDILEIEAADVFEHSSDEKVEKKAIHQYVLETRLGIGNTRLTLGFDAVNCDRARVVLGTKFTLPTVATFSSGFIGSDFKKKVQRGYLNLEEIIEKFTEGTDAEKEEAKDEATCFGIKAVNQMGALLLSTQLGSKRFQAGIYIEPTFHVDNQATVFGSFRANLLAPHTTSRFIKETTSPSDFDDDNFNIDTWPDPDDEARAETELQFLNNRLQNWLFPCCYRVNLQTQQEYQFTIAALFNVTGNWKWTLGYDLWHKTAEKSRIVKQNGTMINTNCIKLCQALQPYATQQKLFTKFEYKKFKESHNFVFNFGADFPLINKNIGCDFTAYLNFEWIF